MSPPRAAQGRLQFSLARCHRGTDSGRQDSRAGGWPGSSSSFSQLLLQLPQALGQGRGQLLGRGASLPGTSSAASGLALGDGRSSHLSPASAALEPPLPAAGRTAKRRPSRQPDWRSPALKGHGHFLGQLCLMQWFCFTDHGHLDVAWVRESPIGDHWDASHPPHPPPVPRAQQQMS